MTRNRYLVLLPLLAALLLSGCVGPSWRNQDAAITAQSEVDFTRYSGQWYEIARYPVRFQRGCTDSRAVYTPREDGRIGIVNTCRRNGTLRQIEGNAEIVGPGQLRVRFDSVPFVAAPYWVLWVDDSYQTAVVGVPSGQSGWILARTPEISPARLDRAKDVLRANGYDPTALIPGR